MLKKLLKVGSLVLTLVLSASCSGNTEVRESTAALEDYTAEPTKDARQRAIIKLPKGFRLVEVVRDKPLIGYRIEPMDSGYVPKKSYYVDDIFGSDDNSNPAYVYTFIESW
jgi:hypothetical protein